MARARCSLVARGQYLDSGEPRADAPSPPGVCPLALGVRQDLRKLAGVVGKGVDRDVVALEHRYVEIAERSFVLLLDEAAVAQAQVLASGENGRIVAGVVGGAGTAAVKGHGVVE